MNLRQLWKGALNVFDLLFTRGADAAASLLLVYSLSPDEYSVLGVAQSLVAPLFLFFINPGTILYRDYGELSRNPLELKRRASSFRAFNRILFIISTTFCLIIAYFSFHHHFPNILFATIWALMLTVGQSLMNIDRELLRLETKWKKLLFLNIAQKLSTILMIYFVLLKKIGGIEMLAICLSIQQIAFMIIYQVMAFGVTDTIQDLFLKLPSLRAAFQSLREFSLLHHLNWTIFATIQTLEVLLWGFFQADRKFEIGIYSSVLKLTNLITAVPTAMGITLMIWASQKIPRSNSPGIDPRVIRLGLIVVTLISILLCVGVWGFKDSLFTWLSRGRWSESQLQESFQWLSYLLPAYGLLSVVSYFWYFLSTQIKPGRFLFIFSLPLLVFSTALYSWVCIRGNIFQIAQCNLVIAAVMLVISGALMLFPLKKPDTIFV
jgi:hypothetical protein